MSATGNCILRRIFQNITAGDDQASGRNPSQPPLSESGQLRTKLNKSSAPCVGMHVAKVNNPKESSAGRLWSPACISK
jgi:hypothetical protein